MREHRPGRTPYQMQLEEIVEQRLLPRDAHVIAAQIEDNLRIWTSRTPGTFHPLARAACVEATRLCGEMIGVFGRLRDDLTTELGTYDDERMRG